MEEKTNKIFGLLGRNISYSFSRGYFTKKFEALGLRKYLYKNFDLQKMKDLPQLLEQEVFLKGMNVTIPYKEVILPYLDSIDVEAKEIGAVNTIKIVNNQLVGYNTDHYGFKKSLVPHLKPHHKTALILGTGGAAKTITYFCIKYNIPYNLVSRQKSNLHLSYNELDEYNFTKRVLIVNCTPLGTYPDVNKSPKLPFELINKENIFFYLVYNPSETLFMKKGKEIGCKTLNGYEMLRLQAEMSWKIWTD